MSGAVGKVAVLKSQSHNGKVLVTKMGPLAPLTGALLMQGGRQAATKILPKVVNRLRAIPRAWKVGGETAKRSRLGNVMDMLRGEEWHNYATTPKKFGGYLEALNNPEFQALLPEGGLDATSEFAAKTAGLTNPTATQLIQPRRQAANKFLSNQFNQGAPFTENIHSSLINTDIGQHSLSAAAKPMEALTPSEMGHLGTGAVGVQSTVQGAMMNNQANLAQQTEEARRLQERAAGAATGTTGTHNMGSMNSSTG